MKLPRRKFLHLVAGAAALPAVSRIAWAQTYPAGPVQIIVGYPPGGATDFMARLIAQQLSGQLGQQFIVDNRPGPGGNIGTEEVVRSQPDGYTLLLIFLANAINATFYDKLSFNFHPRHRSRRSGDRSERGLKRETLPTHAHRAAKLTPRGALAMVAGRIAVAVTPPAGMPGGPVIVAVGRRQRVSSLRANRQMSCRARPAPAEFCFRASAIRRSRHL